MNMARYRKSVSAGLWVQITLEACYLSRALLIPFRYISSESDCEVSLIIGLIYTAFLVLLNSSLTPFVFCWKIREVRPAVKDTLTQCCLCN